MNRYQATFERLKVKREGALIPFVTLGDPDITSSLAIVETLISSGADALELGIPFSDPIADGPTIQDANLRALQSGMTTINAFEMIKNIRTLDEEIPIGLLVYANLVLAYGMDNFYRTASESGADSILVADLPIEEATPWRGAANEWSLAQILLVSLTTPVNRMKEIAHSASAFIYLVTATGVTGARENLDRLLSDAIIELKQKTSLPICTGFGVSKPEHVKALVSSGADGVIVGSAIIEKIQKNIDRPALMLDEISGFVAKLKEETKN